MKVKITMNDAQECLHKMCILSDTPDLQDDYGLTQDQADEIRDSIPPSGGEWIIPEWAEKAVCGEMQNHVKVTRDICDDMAGVSDQVGHMLAAHRQANKFEKMFGGVR